MSSKRLCQLKSELRSLEQCNQFEDFVLVESLFSKNWANLFNSLFLSDQFKNHMKDDLLFFVRCPMIDDLKGTEENDKRIVDVFRMGSKSVPRPLSPTMPIKYDWKHSVFMNTVLHQFEYVVIVAVTKARADSSGIDVISKFSKRVCACPTIIRDKYDKTSKTVYSPIEFVVDTNGEKDAKTVIVESGQLLCVELIGHDDNKNDDSSNESFSFFLGSVKKDVLSKVLIDREKVRRTSNDSLWKRLTKQTKRHEANEQSSELVTMKEPKGRGTAEVWISVVPATNTQTSAWRQSLDCVISTSNEILTKKFLSTSDHNGSLKWPQMNTTGNLQRRNSMTFRPLNWISQELLNSPMSPSNPCSRVAVRVGKITLSCESIVNDALVEERKPVFETPSTSIL